MWRRRRSTTTPVLVDWAGIRTRCQLVSDMSPKWHAEMDQAEMSVPALMQATGVDVRSPRDLSLFVSGVVLVDATVLRAEWLSDREKVAACCTTTLLLRALLPTIERAGLGA